MLEKDNNIIKVHISEEMLLHLMRGQKVILSQQAISHEIHLYPPRMGYFLSDKEINEITNITITADSLNEARRRIEELFDKKNFKKNSNY